MTHRTLGVSGNFELSVCCNDVCRSIDRLMDRIEIKGYKSIKDLSLSLRPINILVGANGCGKSNLLSFFELLKNIYACNQQGYVALNGTMDKFLFGGRNMTDEISAHMYFGKNGYSFTLKAAEEGLVFRREDL